MKKILSWSSLLLFASALFMGAGCTEEEVAEGAAGVVGGTVASISVGLIICFWVVAGLLVGLFLFVVWIIALVDCSRRKLEEFPKGTGGENAKTLWLVILIVTFFVTQLHGIAAIVYYFMVMKKKPISR
ncbi:MAG: hypothetical protein U9O59_01925 [Actinomycetota bacterium]|nr:hypothetical protein [Actinomycetota bacterium]